MSQIFKRDFFGGVDSHPYRLMRCKLKQKLPVTATAFIMVLFCGNITCIYLAKLSTYGSELVYISQCRELIGSHVQLGQCPV